MFQYMYIYTENETNGNCSFRLFAANGKQKGQTSVCFLKTGNGKRKFVFLDRQTRKVKRCLPF